MIEKDDTQTQDRGTASQPGGPSKQGPADLCAQVSSSEFLKFSENVPGQFPTRVYNIISDELFQEGFTRGISKRDSFSKRDVQESFPRGYGTTHSGYETTPVWCRGGSRCVEGRWGFPCLKIKISETFISI